MLSVRLTHNQTCKMQASRLLESAYEKSDDSAAKLGVANFLFPYDSLISLYYFSHFPVPIENVMSKISNSRGKYPYLRINHFF